MTKIKNEDKLRQELLFSLSPALKNDYYLNHLRQYALDREAILKLSAFFLIIVDSFTIFDLIK